MLRYSTSPSPALFTQQPRAHSGVVGPAPFPDRRS